MPLASETMTTTSAAANVLGINNLSEEPSWTSCPDDRHPHMIDLGLPSGTKWACCNVGASKPEDYGGYYRWGETNPLVLGETPAAYPYDGVDIGDNISGTQYDAATANWGTPWRMPTIEQIQELLEYCTNVLVEQDGVNGRKFTGTNGATIFLPAAGYDWNSILYDIGSTGGYWSSTSWTFNSIQCACCLNVYLDRAEWQDNSGRLAGLSVRPVQTDNSPEEESQSYTYDVNNDGEVSSADITCLINHILGNNNPGEVPSYTSCPDDHHPHMIDLGLLSGTKWACCNVGASTPEDYGGYYRWGETSPLVLGETPAAYPYDGVDLGDNISGTQYDAATASWGASWRMPTKEQMDELFANCTNTWTTQNGVNGRKFTDSNGRTIFLPAAGVVLWDGVDYVGSRGNYWSSIPVGEGAYVVDFENDWDWGEGPLDIGRSVRPVQTGNSPEEESPSYTYDVNNDGKVSVADITCLIKEILRLTQLKTLETGSQEEVQSVLEMLSGTDRTDVEDVIAALNNNSNVEEAYTVDGDNLIIKMKDDDSYAACPMYSLESVFSDTGEMEYLIEDVNNSRIRRGAKQPSGQEKVAIFNFFEGGPYHTKSLLASFISDMFKANLYKVENYGQGYENGGTPTFTMSKLDDVISRSSEYTAIIIMSHGYKTEDGETYFATCEKYNKGMSYPSNQTVIIDNNRFVAHSSQMNLSPNCLLYLGPCDAIPQSGYGNTNTSVIGWQGKNAISQIHAGVFFHKLLYSNAWVGVRNAWMSSFTADPFNPSTKLFVSDNVYDWDYAFNSGIQREYEEGLTVELGDGKDRFIKKTNKQTKLRTSGYIKGNADEIISAVRVQLEPIVRIQNPGEYSFSSPASRLAKLSTATGGADFYFEVDIPFDDNMLEGIYRINVYKKKEHGWGLMIQPEPVYVIYSSRLDDNYALPVASESDIYVPTILDTDGQAVDEITVAAGSSVTLKAEGYAGHTFETPCLNNNVATVSLSGTTLTVTGVSEGTTYFGVYDVQNRQIAVVKVTVTPGTNPEAYFFCPDDHHPHLIDLGLPSGTKWACCNVGASNPEDYGDYFAWGETTGYNGGKTNFDWSTYKWCNGSYSSMTKYCTKSSYGNNGFTDDKTELDPEDDAAYVNWNPAWRMPSIDQYSELINSNYTTTELTTQNGVYGRKITSKMEGYEGNFVFLPAAGDRSNSSLGNAGSYGDYWSRSLYESGPGYARYLYFDSGSIGTDRNYRYRGRSVRPVRLSE